MSYALAACSFALLTVLLCLSWRRRRPGVHLIAAAAITAGWAALSAVEEASASVPFLGMYVAEVLRNSAWLLLLAALCAATVPRLLTTGARTVCALLLVAPLVGAWLESAGLLLIEPILLMSRAGLAQALLGLVLLEQIYRNAAPPSRSALRFLTIGVGLLFAYDLFLYSQAELLRGVSLDAWQARGIVNALAVPFIAIAARRNPDWPCAVFVSRHVVFYSATFLGAGVYLVIVAIGGYYVRELGGNWGRLGQILFFVGALVVLINLMASTTLRRHARVFISKHFYSNKYDYRVEWLRFIATLSSIEEGDVRRTAVRAMAQIFSSPGGLLFLRDDSERRLVAHAAWPMRLDSVPGLAELSSQDDLPQFLARKQWIIDTQEYRRTPDVYENIALPAWLLTHTELRIISPLLQLDTLVGFVVLYDPPPPFELNYEDRDLLKTVGRHVATHIAQHDAHRKLAENRQFEAYNRLTAFMMHDLKNSLAQLKLIVANAERHKRNPAFIDDTIGTITNTVERMTKLIEQLRGAGSADRWSTIDLSALAREAVLRCEARAPKPQLSASQPAFVRANAERLTAVIEHIIRNAQEATVGGGSVSVEVRPAAQCACLCVTDTGVGMDADFLRERLFRPFDSTKGSKGMGIGAYQVREYIQTLGGTVEVQSSPGRGTRFTVNLPLTEPEAQRVSA